MSGWRETTLDQVVELKRGLDLPSHARRAGPIPVLSAGSTAGWHDTVGVKGPGMVVGRATNLGRPTWSDTDFWPLNTTLYAASFKGNEPKWVYHLFESMDFTGFDSGSVQPMLNRNYIAKVRVKVPPVNLQRAIADVLSALDDRIAANTRLATTADELAQLEFDSMLSDGSAEVPLSNCARFVNGKNFTKGATGVGRVVIRIAELNSGIGNSTVRNEVEASEDNTAHPGDLLFAWSGSLTVHRWYFDEGIINQHIFKVIPSGGYPVWLINQLLLNKLGDFKSIAADKATTMGHIQRRHLDEPVRIPSIDVVAREHRSMQALWDRALMAERENQTLIATRDALLPALMSGRLTVRDAEATVESAFDGGRVEPEALASGKLW